MSPDDARAVLGVPADASAETLRSAFRSLMRRTHPDLAGPDATDRAARVITAYQVLRDAPAVASSGGGGPSTRSPRPSASAATSREEVVVTPLGGGLFAELHEAAEVLGDLRYVDPARGVLETVVAWEGWPPCSLLLEVVPGDTSLLAQCTLEPLVDRPGPPIGRVVAELHRILAALAE